ncbi:Zinc finger, CCCH-type [Dillenia turbinata]|uniref:Zinc finger, CCCH-type n=1 Tax=Dillenia turbinata TaxID=194707 RepID=A0AAN8VXH7_9MAGN
MHPQNGPVNKPTGKIFFKTRMCAKFKVGLCRNGESCNFAHGIEDMRKPPPNWQELVSGGRSEEQESGNWEDDQRIIHRMKLCKKFYNGEECPYGERCNFLHEAPAKFREDKGRYRESVAISIGTTGPQMGHANRFDQFEVNNKFSGSDALQVNTTRPVYWKTKLCIKWETTGHCPFGEKCHFAHGQAELQMHIGQTEGEVGIVTAMSSKLPPAPTHNTTPSVVAPMASATEEGKRKCLLKWKGLRKINRIYGDWIDDLPLELT